MCKVKLKVKAKTKVVVLSSQFGQSPQCTLIYGTASQ